MKELLLTGWHPMRWLRLALAIAFIANGIYAADKIIIAMGGFLLFQAAFNTGCCGTVTCSNNTYTKHNSNKEPTTVEYEEMKEKRG